MKILEAGCHYKFSGLDFTTFRVCLTWNFMLREVMPRGPSKRAQTDWQMRSEKGQRLGDAYYTVYKAPGGIKKPRPGSWTWLEADSHLLVPYALGNGSNVQTVLLLYFCRHTFHCNQKAFGLTTCKLHAKEMKSGNIALFRPSVPQTPTLPDRKLIVGSQHLQ